MHSRKIFLFGVVHQLKFNKKLFGVVFKKIKINFLWCLVYNVKLAGPRAVSVAIGAVSDSGERSEPGNVAIQIAYRCSQYFLYILLRKNARHLLNTLLRQNVFNIISNNG